MKTIFLQAVMISGLIATGIISPDHRPLQAASPSADIVPWDAIESTFVDEPLVVVDLWSLSCAPCLKEFPGLVRMQRLFGSSVRCVSVSVDYDGRRRRPPQTYLARVESFLNSVDAENVDNYVCATPSDDVLRDLDVASIPAVLIFQNGKRIRSFVDVGSESGFSYADDVIPAVKAILAGNTSEKVSTKP